MGVPRQINNLIRTSTHAPQVPSSGSINECQACLGTKALWNSLQTDHLIGISAHASQRPMVTHTGMDTVGYGPHGLWCH
ncbi:hypothetical protein TNCV_4804701 [Trichonephila clavipes]|nr:hypothetical protein TNCV_4804701 [Trichonephila clavipes]